MKIVFFGSSDFAVKSLEALIEQHSVLTVVTQPDRRKGRHLTLSDTPVKTYAKAHNISVLQPQKVGDERIRTQLKNFNADLFVVVSFGQILSKEVLEIPKIFSINAHASVLPRWRGAAPINWAIMNGDKTSGVSIIKMNEFMDRGAIILTKSISIQHDDAITLTEKLSRLSAEALLEAIDSIERQKVQFSPQQESLVKIARKLKKEDGLINWPDEARAIHNKVRALLPWPCAYTHFKGKFIKILKTDIIEGNSEIGSENSPGEILEMVKQKGIIVATLKGNLLIEMLQLEGKRAMPAYDFVLGHKMLIGDKLG